MAAEEAAAAEAERLRLEEIERKKIAAEDAVFEAEEAARVAAADAKLASQAEAAALVDAAHAEELAHLRRAEREAYEWDRFASCCSRPDPRDPRAMLAYETAARASTDSGLSLGGALDQKTVDTLRSLGYGGEVERKNLPPKTSSGGKR